MRLPSRQAGAAALFAAIGLIGMLVAAAFAIDLAQLHIVRRELQNMANLAALDTARAAGGCLAPDLDRQLEANTAALAAIDRLGGESTWLSGNRVNLGRFAIDANNLRQFQNVPEEDAGEAYAFEVLLQRPMPNLIMPMPGTDVSGATLSARGVAAMAPTASFAVGAVLVSVDPGDGDWLNEALGGALGASPGLDDGDFIALINSSANLLDLADALNVPPEDVLQEPQQLPGLLQALADILFDAGFEVASAAVQQAADQAPAEPIVLGDAVGSPQDFVQGTGSAGLNSYALVQAMVMESAQPVFQLTPGTPLPPGTDLELGVSIDEASNLAAGPAQQDATGSYLTRATNTRGTVDAALGLDLGALAVELDLSVVVAEATGELQAIRCANRNRPQHEVDIAVDTSIARLEVNNGPGNPLVEIPAVPGLGICWSGSVDISDAHSELLTFTGPFDPDDADVIQSNTQTVGTDIGTALANGINDLLVESPPDFCGAAIPPLLEPVVSPLLDVVLTTLEPALTDLIDPVLTPLLRGLGIHVGGADVAVFDVYVQPPALIVSE